MNMVFIKGATHGTTSQNKQIQTNKQSHMLHNIIQCHNIVQWDWQYFEECSNIHDEYGEYST